jgi:hypothetical protein
LSRVCSVAASACGVAPAAATSLRNGSEIFPSARTRLRADMLSCWKTRTKSMSPVLMTYSASVEGSV